jgi:hypothetical protein
VCSKRPQKVVDPAEPIFEMDWIATQFILIFTWRKTCTF